MRNLHSNDPHSNLRYHLSNDPKKWSFWRDENTKRTFSKGFFYSSRNFFPCNWILSAILGPAIVRAARVASVHSLVPATSNAHMLPVKWFSLFRGRDSCSQENGENDRWRTRHGMKYRHHTESICSSGMKRDGGLVPTW